MIQLDWIDPYIISNSLQFGTKLVIHGKICLQVVHGDLAARNILLTHNNLVKICDFGLAKTVYNDPDYKRNSKAPLPIKWMAIESIRDLVFSSQSDVWSFGIMLWEFFTLAESPYPGIPVDLVYQKLLEGYRMECPYLASPEMLVPLKIKLQ